ncbi:hypothetical protein FB45DRAFT_909864 [Roridomyces roridus]|uniref:Probable RNA-binding protein 18 n=1 Tax=Roridomyces roridus TaxID=1738132 RepID=A0AAD7BZ99_9AGAR|nr:hypothetical protein FB45DRAFT_909864 [Roridomyces roridus]
MQSEPSPPSLEDHLSYPTFADDAVSGASTSKAPPRQLLQDRLYIGNLHPSVDEYSLLQVFSKFGKVTKLDFLFHKTGLLKGKPRGYAFVEYGNKDDALKALNSAHDKLLRGRKLVVTFAQQAPVDPGTFGSLGAKHRKGTAEATRPTTLSMIKTGMGNNRNEGTRDKIAMMEAKLRQMERSKASDQAPSGTPPYHPSLPAKPVPQSEPSNQLAPRPQLRPPIPSETQGQCTLPALPFALTPPTTLKPTRKTGASTLIGVKLKKPKKDPSPKEVQGQE